MQQSLDPRAYGRLIGKQEVRLKTSGSFPPRHHSAATLGGAAAPERPVCRSRTGASRRSSTPTTTASPPPAATSSVGGARADRRETNLPSRQRGGTCRTKETPKAVGLR